MSKHVFARFFETDAIRSFHLILTRFPLGIKYPPELNCDSMMGGGRGYYGVESVWSPSGDFLPGDNGLHETADGDWFDQNNHQILCVPFPRNWEQDNLAEARLWVNFKEDVAASTEPCTSVGVSLTQCKGGFCAPNDNSEKVCWYHNDPELRAWGNTPLGRSMFYAGELFRKEIRVDGRSCATHADCKNRNYYCSTGGTCKDPMAHCRVNMIVLFTDGEETPATQTSEFFNPQVQAKRFRYGLGCSGDEDCFDGSVCQGAMCQGYPTPNGSGTSPPPNTALPWRLMTYQGNPVQISTHVIDVSGGSTGSATNRAIADHGGGSYFHASEMDPDELLNQLLSIIDVKQNLLGCIPDWEGIALDAL
jgi:hypothetical protein